jgi:hypothetical protein
MACAWHLFFFVSAQDWESFYELSRIAEQKMDMKSQLRKWANLVEPQGNWLKEAKTEIIWLRL